MKTPVDSHGSKKTKKIKKPQYVPLQKPIRVFAQSNFQQKSVSSLLKSKLRAGQQKPSKPHSSRQHPHAASKTITAAENNFIF